MNDAPPGRILLAYAPPSDPAWIDRLDRAATAGRRLGLARPSDISVFEGDWPGGSVGVWRFPDTISAREAAAAIAPAAGGFALAMPERPGASSPAIGGGLMLVQGLFTDAAKAAAYNQALPPIYALHDGFYLVLARADMIEHLAGDWEPKAVVLAAFPSPAASANFWYSPEYGAAKLLRAGGGDFLVVAFPGL